MKGPHLIDSVFFSVYHRAECVKILNELTNLLE